MPSRLLLNSQSGNIEVIGLSFEITNLKNLKLIFEIKLYSYREAAHTVDITVNSFLT